MCHEVLEVFFRALNIGGENRLLGLPGFLGPASGYCPWLGPSIQEDCQRDSVLQHDEVFKESSDTEGACFQVPSTFHVVRFLKFET
jgi:hypothetical protein